MEENQVVDDTQDSQNSNFDQVSESADLTDRIATLEALVSEEKDKALRARAEFENFRRRKDQEVETFKTYANEKLILEFLPVLDSFDRAVESATSDHSSAVLDGFQLIQKQFQGVLEKLGVQSIESIGTKFDPNVHMAVSQESVEGVESQTVLKEFQRGYRYHDRVIRPAMVVVAQ